MIWRLNMKCSFCSRSGYNLQRNESNQYWCGTCEATPGSVRTLTGGSNAGFRGYTGVGSVASLPGLCTLQEWQEIAKLCKRVSSPKLLTEEKPFKPLPLPHEKNPLEEKPTDKRSGWTPLTEYMKNMNTKDQFSPENIKKNLFDQKSNRFEKRNLFEG